MKLFRGAEATSTPTELKEMGLNPCDFGYQDDPATSDTSSQHSPYRFAVGGIMTSEGWIPTPRIATEVWDHDVLDGENWTAEGEMRLTHSIGKAAVELGIYQ